MTIDIAPFSDSQWLAMCSVELGLPEPLSRADLSRPFIYDRAWGVFMCPTGYHQAAMGLLLAFHQGSTDRLAVAEALGLEVPYGAADHYLATTPGTAFRSSVGVRAVSTWGPASLTPIEKRLLGPLRYIDPAEAV